MASGGAGGAGGGLINSEGEPLGRLLICIERPSHPPSYARGSWQCGFALWVTLCAAGAVYIASKCGLALWVTLCAAGAVLSA